ncbi:MAG: type II secretion system protein [Candidatus Acidiferrales bacterium]
MNRPRIRSPRAPQSANGGFTLIELMVVIAIIVIIASIAVGRYEQSIVRANEAALHQDLRSMREAIQQYTLDKEEAPSSLDDLVSAGYIREVPTDPITRQKDWNTTSDDLLLSPEQSSVGITDVHSASDKISPFENTPYSSW